MKTAWRRVSKEKVFKTPIFDLNCEKSECLRTGVMQNFFYINCADWVNIIALTPERELVMIRQYRHGSDCTELEIPGGGLDKKDSDPVVGGARELFEETGYRGKNGRVIGQVCPNPAIQGNTCYTVMFDDCEQISAPELEDTEVIETILIPENDLRQLITSGAIRHGLVLNALHFLEIQNGYK